MKTGVESEVSVVYVTVPAPGAEDVAKTLAGSLIENKLAACVNILPGLLVLYYICLLFVLQTTRNPPSATCPKPCSEQQPDLAS